MEKSKYYGSWRKQWAIIFACLFLAIIIGLCLLIPIFTTRSQNEALIKIPQNADRQQVEDSVRFYLGDEIANGLSKVSYIKKPDYASRHGAYFIEKGMTPLEVYRKLTTGAQHPIRVTINGIKLPTSLAKKISDHLDILEDVFLATLSNDTLFSHYGLNKDESMALFIEDSYDFFWNASPETVIRKIGAHYEKIWNEERTTKAKNLGLSPADIMIIASITDEESNKIDEKGKIGRLYINRLKKGMKLQADPTVKYAVGDFSLRRIKGEHLKTDSPYNTYLHTGLPPGPIRTTSVSTIDKILDSSPNDYIYMCAKDDFSGYHAFATNYQDHMKNARSYQRALNKRGIK